MGSTDFSSSSDLIVRAKAAQARQDWESAEALLNTILEKNPSHPEANYRLGCMALEADEGQDALAMAATALKAQPTNRAYQRLKALSLKHLISKAAQANRWVDVMARADQLRRQSTEASDAYGWLATAHMKLGCMDDCRTAFRRRIQKCPPDAWMYSQWIGLHAGDPATDAEAYYRLAKSWDTRFQKDRPTPHHKPVGDARMRIGIVSTTLHNHANANFLLPLLKELQSYPIDVYIFHDGATDDFVTEATRARSTSYANISKLSLEQAAERIGEDQLHILIDINGHFDRSRMQLYSLRPAPIQIHYLGGTGALAMESIDGRLADCISEPPTETARPHDRIYRIEGGIHAFQPLTKPVRPSAPPVLTHGHITFGVCNALHKIEKPTLGLWAKLLNANPNSRLRIVKDTFAVAQNRNHVQQFIKRVGLPAERVDLLPTTQNCRYEDLSIYNSIDIALDTAPYNGITTTCEALWMGVPVVTLQGNRFVAREAGAILTHAGYPQWIGQDQKHYLKICSQLAEDTAQLIELRKKLPLTFQSSPVCDAHRLARELVTLFRELHLNPK